METDWTETKYVPICILITVQQQRCGGESIRLVESGGSCYLGAEQMLDSGSNASFYPTPSRELRNGSWLTDSIRQELALGVHRQNQAAVSLPILTEKNNNNHSNDWYCSKLENVYKHFGDVHILPFTNRNKVRDGNTTILNGRFHLNSNFVL